MNKNNAKELLPFVQALAEGKTVQYWINNAWCDQSILYFEKPASYYRVKPETKTVRLQGWVCIESYETWERDDIRQSAPRGDYAGHWRPFSTEVTIEV